MNCPHCQKEMPEDHGAAYCPLCGKDLSSEPADLARTLPPVKFNSLLFFAALLLPPLLTLLSAAAMRYLVSASPVNEGVSVVVGLLSGVIGGAVCGVLVGLKTSRRHSEPGADLFLVDICRHNDCRLYYALLFRLRLGWLPDAVWMIKCRIASPIKLTDELLKRTTSRCPICHVSCPAESLADRWSLQSKVLLKRTCAEHGEASVCIASDARFYWLAKGKPGNSCCGDGAGSTSACCQSADGSNPGTLGRNAHPGDALGVMEKLSTCLALIEIVNSCNLSCPTCYADSPLGTGGKIDAEPLAALQARIQGVIDRKGTIEILQLSGGEPTLHPQFFELLRWLHANPGIDYVLLNTNGVRIAHDEAFAAELASTFRYGKFQLYLQFDGVQAAGQKFLRGADLRTTRERCLERCAEMKLPVTLAMTVTPENLAHLWETAEFGLRWPNDARDQLSADCSPGRIPKRP